MVVLYKYHFPRDRTKDLSVLEVPGQIARGTVLKILVVRKGHHKYTTAVFDFYSQLI